MPARKKKLQKGHVSRKIEFPIFHQNSSNKKILDFRIIKINSKHKAYRGGRGGVWGSHDPTLCHIFWLKLMTPLDHDRPMREAIPIQIPSLLKPSQWNARTSQRGPRASNMGVGANQRRLKADLRVYMGQLF